MTIPADFHNSKESNPTPPMTLWPSQWKGSLSQVDGLAKENSKKNVNESKPTVASQKTCICAPTSHAGSFRCHLHRNSLEIKSQWSLGDSGGKKSKSNFESMKMALAGKLSNRKPQLSRFGKAAFAANNASGNSK